MRHRLIRRLEVPRPRDLDQCDPGIESLSPGWLPPSRVVAFPMAVRALGVGSLPAVDASPHRDRGSQGPRSGPKALSLTAEGAGRISSPGPKVAGLHLDDFHVHLFAVLHTIRRGTPILPDEPIFCVIAGSRAHSMTSNPLSSDTRVLRKKKKRATRALSA